jgi:hypothetical protein
VDIITFNCNDFTLKSLQQIEIATFESASAFRQSESAFYSNAVFRNIFLGIKFSQASSSAVAEYL